MSGHSLFLLLEFSILIISWENTPTFPCPPPIYDGPILSLMMSFIQIEFCPFGQESVYSWISYSFKISVKTVTYTIDELQHWLCFPSFFPPSHPSSFLYFSLLSPSLSSSLSYSLLLPSFLPSFLSYPFFALFRIVSTLVKLQNYNNIIVTKDHKNLLF